VDDEELLELVELEVQLLSAYDFQVMIFQFAQVQHYKQ
jgi:translation elongation factor EF-Tu-like GTPase